MNRNRKIAKRLTVSRKNHYPIETLFAASAPLKEHVGLQIGTEIKHYLSQGCFFQI